MSDTKRSPWLSHEEEATLKELLPLVIGDTVSCWISTQLEGLSSSLACDGNVNKEIFDALSKIAQLVKEKQNVC